MTWLCARIQIYFLRLIQVCADLYKKSKKNIVLEKEHTSFSSGVGCVYECVCVRECVCVCERERASPVELVVCTSVCVCVCV